MTRVLFTGGGGAGGEAIVRLLSKRYVVYLADADPQRITTAIPSERRHKIPLASASNFVSEVKNLCDLLQIDLLVPGVDEELLKLVDINNTKVLSPTAEYIRMMLDKYSSNCVLQSRAINVPNTSLASNSLRDKLDLYPCIAKPRYGRGSRNVVLLESPEQLTAYLTLTKYDPDQVVLQELLIGQEFTVMMAADGNGTLHAVVPVEVELKKGITLRGVTKDNDAIIEACKAIHNAIPTTGCYNVQLMLVQDGRALPFEINPRISTTFCLGYQAGIDPIQIFLSKEFPKQLKQFQSGLVLERYWMNKIFIR